MYVSKLLTESMYILLASIFYFDNRIFYPHFSFDLVFLFPTWNVDYSEDKASEIVGILVDEGIYDILSEAFEKETVEDLLV